MKKFSFLIIFFILFAQSIHAQLFSKDRLLNIETFDKQFLTWGYFLGFNSYDFNFDYHQDKRDIFVERTTGFNVGLIGDMRINNHINIRLEPGLFITTRMLKYDSSHFDGFAFDDNDLERELKSTYIHLPLLFKFSTKRINNIKPFVVAGVSTSLNLGSNEKNPFDNFQNEFRMKRSTYYYELGFGIDLYLYWFKFTPSIRGVFAFNDELIRDNTPNSPWTGNVVSMKTRGVFINFTFQ